MNIKKFKDGEKVKIQITKGDWDKICKSMSNLPKTPISVGCSLMKDEDCPICEEFEEKFQKANLTEIPDPNGVVIEEF